MKKRKKLLLEPLEQRIMLDATPAVDPSIDVQEEVFLNESFSFSVDFRNEAPQANEAGFKPFIDITIPTGVDFNGASFLGSALNPVASVVFPDDGGGTGTIQHPILEDNTGTPVDVVGNAGDTLLVFELPFGSFVPGQLATIDIDASLNDQALFAQPLPIKVQGGFAFGQDALDNPDADPPIHPLVTPGIAGVAEQTFDIIPTVVEIIKDNNLPEDETATGPNFPVTFTIDVDVATDETVDNIVITDTLPNNFQFLRVVDADGGTIVSTPGLGGPENDGQIVINFASITGQAGVDRTITYEVFVPEADANTNAVINPATGAAVTSENTVDLAVEFDEDGDGNADFIVVDSDTETTIDRSIAIQKNVAIATENPNTDVVGASPGDVLEYTLEFQISDFFSFEDIVINDVFSDGQVFDASFTPTFSVTNNDGASVNGNFGDQAFGQVTSFQIPEDGNDSVDGSTTVEFSIPGRFDGDLSFDANQVTGTVGTVTFRTIILEEFRNDVGLNSNDLSFDAGDVLRNDVTISANLVDRGTGQVTAVVVTDTSSASIEASRFNASKEVFAVNGDTNADPTTVTPDDVVTYSLRIDLATEDFEDLVFTDFLPLPVFDVQELAGASINAFSGNAPAAGEISLGPNNTFNPALLLGVNPTINANANSITFDIGNNDVVDANSQVIELLISVTTSDAPFGDGLLLTNQLEVNQGSSNNGGETIQAIDQIELREPILNITKAAVSSDNANAVFSGENGNFDNPGTPGFASNVNINSGNNNVDSDIEDIDAGDLVKFAIIIENTGSDDAFDVLIRDAIPAGFAIPNIVESLQQLNLQVTDGNGNAIGFVGNDADLFAGGIELVDPAGNTGAVAEFDGANGNNIVVITYDLIALDNVTPDFSTTETAVIERFAADEGGSDFTVNNAQGTFSDDASAEVAGIALAKVITNTSLGGDTSTNVAIGEVITYQLEVTLPEGQTDLRVVDDIPDGVSFVSGSETIIAGGFGGAVSFDSVVATGNNGEDVTFNFSNIVTNSDNNANNNTFIIQYDAVVLDDSNNVNDGDALTNVATADDPNNVELQAVSDQQTVNVVEPDLRLTKAMTNGPNDAGDTITIDLTLDNVGNSDAFDVTLSDVLDPNLFTNIQAVVTPADFNVNIDAVTGTITFASAGAAAVAVGASLDFQFTAVLTPNVEVNEVITNTATINEYSTLPGADANERTTTDINSNEVNSNVENLQITNINVVKSIVATNQAFTPEDGTVAVGEIVTFEVVITVPEGETPGLILTDTLQRGLAFVDILSVTPSSGDVTTNLGGGFNDALANAQINDVGGGDSGVDRRLIVDFGDVSNSNLDNAIAETITVQYRAVVLNADEIDDGVRRRNDADVDFAGRGASQVSDNVRVTVQEPALNVTVSVDDNQVDQGDTVTFTVRVEHDATSDVDAFNVSVEDIIPAGLTFVNGSLVDTGATAATTLTETNGTIDAVFDVFALGSVGEFQFQATVDNLIAIGDVISNEATLEFTSLPGDVTTAQAANVLSVERTGSNGDPGEVNDFNDNDSVNISVNPPEVLQEIIATSAGNTAFDANNADLTIGETARLRFTVNFPEGTASNVTLTDLLPAGFQFLGNETVNFVSENGITTTLNNVVVNDVNGQDQVVLQLGDVANNDVQDGNNELIIFEFDVLVVDDAVENVNGDANVNTFSFASDDLAQPIESNSVNLIVVEPILQINQQQFIDAQNDGQLDDEVAAGTTDLSIDAGDAVRYVSTIAHNGSLSDAFDLVFTDTIPQDTTLDENSVFVDFGAGEVQLTRDVDFTFDDATRLLTINDATLGDLAINDQIVVRYDVVLDDAINPLDAFQTDAQIDFSSLDGADANERTGQDNDDVNFAITNVLEITTNIVDDQFRIGDSVPGTIDLNFLEGTTENVQVTMPIPAGLTIDEVNAVNIQFFNGASSTVQDIQIVNGDLVVDLGNVTTLGNAGFDNNTPDVQITFDAVIQDDAANNVNTGDKVFDATVTSNNNATDATASSADQVEIVEAILQVEIEQRFNGNLVANNDQLADLDAGDVLNYRAVITHVGDATADDPADSQTDAFNLNFTADVPADTAVTEVRIVDNGGNVITLTEGVDFNVVNDQIVIGEAVMGDLPLGEQVVVEYDVTLQDTVNPLDTFTTDANIDFDSQQVNEGANNVERTGVADAVAADDGAANVNVQMPNLLEITTNIVEDEFTIGDTVTGTIDISLLEGTTENTVIRMPVPDGLTIDPADVSITFFNGASSTIQDIQVINDELVVDFGNVVSPGADGFNNENVDIQIEFDAIVQNVADNDNNINKDFVATANTNNNNVAAQEADQDSILIVEPNIGVTVTADNNQPFNGDTITYTVDLEHLADSLADAHDLQVVIPIPAELTFNGNFNIPDGTLQQIGDDLVFNLDFLAEGDSLSFTFELDLLGILIGTDIDVDADITFDTQQDNGDNDIQRTGNANDDGGALNDLTNSDSEQVTVFGSDLTVTIDDNVDVVQPDDLVSIDINVVNNGNDDSTGITLVHTLPGTVDINQLEVLDANGNDITVQVNVVQNGDGTFDLTFPPFDLSANGDNTDFVINVPVISVIPAAVDDFNHDAAVNDDGTSGIDPTPETNVDDDSDTLDAAPDLVVVNDSVENTFFTDDQIPYLVTITNEGNQDATGVQINYEMQDQLNFETAIVTFANGDRSLLTDLVPAGTEVAVFAERPESIDESDVIAILFDGSVLVDKNNVPAEEDANIQEEFTTVAANVDPGVNVLNADLGDLAVVGEQITIELVARVDAVVFADVDTLETIATVNDDGNNGEDLNLASNVENEVDTLIAVPDLVVTKDNNVTSLAPGDVTIYEINVSNIGDQEAVGVELRDTLPEGIFDFIEASDGGVFDENTNEVVFDLGNLSGNESVTVTVTLQVKQNLFSAGADIDNIVNTVVVSEDQTQGLETRFDNNFAEDVDDFFFFVFDALDSNPIFDAQNAVSNVEGFRIIDPVPLRRLPLLTVNPVYSGTAAANSVQQVVIYGEGGNIIGTQTVMADTGGNWLATFPNTVILETPHHIEIVSQESHVIEDSGFNMRTYFASVLHSNIFAKELSSIEDVAAELTPEEIQSLIKWQEQALLQEGGYLYEFLPLGVPSTK